MQFFQRKFGATSVIKIYSKMCELCMNSDYDHLYIPLTSKKGKFQPQTFFLGITTLFLLSLLLRRSTAADLGFNFRGCAKWNLGFGGHSEPPKGVLGAATEANAFRAICSLKLA